MNKQQFFSWLIYSVIKSGATNPVFKHVGGVVIITYDLNGVKQAQDIIKTDSLNRANQYRNWFNSCIEHVN